MGYYCRNCDRFVPYDVVTCSETVTVAGTEVEDVPQKHAYCIHCRAELHPPLLMEINNYVAKHAYCIRQSRGG